VDQAELCAKIRALMAAGSLPSGHPVMDKLASGQIGGRTQSL
jgi:hypothetical protein